MSAKEMLYERIQDLTEEQAQRILDAGFLVAQPEKVQTTWERLAANPSIELPKGGSRSSRHFEPIQGSGILASQLLIEDRR